MTRGLKILFILLVYVTNLPSPSSGFDFSVKGIGEVEKIEHSNSFLNPDNLLMRLNERREAIILLEGLQELWSGKIGVVLRANIKYLSVNPSFSETKQEEQINELYYQKDFGDWTITSGRKKIRWGVGYAISPTDLITTIRQADDPEDRLYRLKGTDMIRLSSTSVESQYDLIYFPEIIWDYKDTGVKQNRVGFRYYRYLHPIDLSIISTLGEGGKWAGGVNTTAVFGDALELHSEYLYSMDNPTLYPDYGKNPEQFFIASPYSQDKKRGFHDILVGGQYTLENHWNITLEYMYHGGGYSESEWEGFIRHVQFLNRSYTGGNFSSLAAFGLKNSASAYKMPMRRHYFFVRLYKPELISSVSFEWFNFAGLSDTSGLQILQMRYTGFDTWNFYFRLQKPWGSSSSEFGLIPEDFQWIMGISFM